MKIIMGNVIIIRTQKFKLHVSDILPHLKKPEPIIWCCQGIYCILTLPRIQNALDIAADWNKFDEKYISTWNYVLYWDDQHKISSDIGKLICGD